MLPSSQTITLSNPLEQSVDIFRQVAHSRKKEALVRETALRILSEKKIPSQHYYSEAKAIGEWVQKNVRYVRDIKSVETLYDPLTLIDKVSRGEAQGDCDDMSVLIASLLLSIGHTPYYAIVKYAKDAPFSHIYVVVYEKNWGMKHKKRLVIDAINKREKIGWEVPHYEIREIKV